MQLKNPDFRIETTTLCNANCTICPREKLARPKVVMDNEHFFDLVCQALELGATHISLFGYGEPLTDKGLAQKIEYCTKMGLKTFITSNASLLDKRKRESLFNAGLSHIRFSMHGFFENYEAVHRGLKWGKTSNRVFDFVYDNIILDKPCKISMSVIPMHGENVEEIRKFWESMVDWLEIWYPHNWTDGKSYRRVAKKKKTCGRPFNGPVQIQADGKMVVCCFDYNGRLEVGDTRKQSVRSILIGDRFNAIREKHKKGDLTGLVCDGCDQLNIEEKSPLMYSNRDDSCGVGTTSSTKTKLKEF